jgi:hypothetical protein
MSVSEEKRVPDGSSHENFTEALHEAVEYKLRGEPEKPGIRFNVTDMWLETIEHNSPWHITYNVKITKAPDSD